MKTTVEQGNIHWEAAQALVQAAVMRAEELGVTINVAVVDSGGHLAAFLRMPGSAFHSIDVAIDKAYTSMSFGMPTSKWADVLDNLSAACRTGLPTVQRMMTCGGGAPIDIGGRRIGAIGVSGATEQQDEEIAQYALGCLRSDAKEGRE